MYNSLEKNQTKKKKKEKKKITEYWFPDAE